ncbi:condensation domain-containing protein, partial [Streptomyces sp. NPDC001292]|uniref:condensation domain-containing protein n=1 Tax=Streptomyces sp. NPDC001292 TaxID=3364558 RepID=UPI00367D9254
MAASEGELCELTASQLGIWNAQQLAPDNPIYNIAERVDIHGALDLDLFVEAMRRTLDEAQTYHLRFHVDSGVPHQYLAISHDHPIRVVDLTGEPDPGAAAEQWMQQDARSPVDLTTGPLFVQAVFRLAEDHVVWYQRSHHLVFDGYSGVVLSGRLQEIYSALLEDREPTGEALEPLSLLMDADRAYRDSEEFQEDRAFWLDTLAGFPEETGQGGHRFRDLPDAPIRHTEEFGAGEATVLKASARRLKTSLAGLMITAAALYQHRMTGARDVAVAVPVLGRVGKRELRVPGLTANLLPIRLTIAPDTRVQDLVRQASRKIRDGLRHQRYRYEDMHRDLNLIDSAPLCALYINVMSFAYPLQFGDCVTTVRNVVPGPIDDLGIDVYDRSADGSIQIAFGANPDLHTRDAVEDVSRRFQQVLNWLTAASPDDSVREVDVLGEVERRRVLVEWNDTAAEVPDVSLVGLLESQVARTPDAVAVVAGDVSLSYAELDARANRLARLLIGCGVGPESVVGVALERGVDLVVALWGVLKAGAAYLPVDPELPVERIAFMLGDAGAAAVVTVKAFEDVIAEDVPSVVLDSPEVSGELAGLDSSAPGVVGSIAHPAYVIYTSGSTGLPKGVVV